MFTTKIVPLFDPPFALTYGVGAYFIAVADKSPWEHTGKRCMQERGDEEFGTYEEDGILTCNFCGVQTSMDSISLVSNEREIAAFLTNSSKTCMVLMRDIRFTPAFWVGEVRSALQP